VNDRLVVVRHRAHRIEQFADHDRQRQRTVAGDVVSVAGENQAVLCCHQRIEQERFAFGAGVAFADTGTRAQYVVAIGAGAAQRTFLHADHTDHPVSHAAHRHHRRHRHLAGTQRQAAPTLGKFGGDDGNRVAECDRVGVSVETRRTGNRRQRTVYGNGIPRPIRFGVAQPVDDPGEDGNPLVDAVLARRCRAQGAKFAHQPRQATRRLQSRAVDVVVRCDAAEHAAGVRCRHRRTHQQAIERVRPCRVVDGDAQELLPVVAVKPPAGAERSGPRLEHGEVVGGQPECSPHGRQRSQVQKLGNGAPAGDHGQHLQQCRGNGVVIGSGNVADA
jgi:hypothetical protein